MADIIIYPVRKLIERFPDLPRGAGIYRLPDGSTKFYNCFPGEAPPFSSAFPDYEAIIEDERKQAKIDEIGLHIVDPKNSTE